MLQDAGDRFANRDAILADLASRGGIMAQLAARLSGNAVGGGANAGARSELYKGVGDNVGNFQNTPGYQFLLGGGIGQNSPFQPSSGMGGVPQKTMEDYARDAVKYYGGSGPPTPENQPYLEKAQSYLHSLANVRNPGTPIWGNPEPSAEGLTSAKYNYPVEGLSIAR
jgi:hypothetical protein